MSQQRLILLIASALGIFSLFLPWQVLPFTNEMANGLHGNGWLVMACLVIAAVAAVAGKRRQHLGRLLRITCLLAGLAGSALMLVFLGGFSGGEAREDIGYAPYLSALACITILATSFFYRPSDTGPAQDKI